MLYERMAIKRTKMKQTFPHAALAFFFILLLRRKWARRRGEAAKTKWRQKPPFFSRRRPRERQRERGCRGYEGVPDLLLGMQVREVYEESQLYQAVPQGSLDFAVVL